VQYTSLKYDYKPHRIDYEKQGILETSDARVNECWIRLPLEVDDSSSSSRASQAFKGQRQDLQSNGVSKECILVIDREAGTITLEHVTSKVDVKQTRGEESKEVHFKPRPARKTKSSSRLEDSSSSHRDHHRDHHDGPPSRKQNRPETKISKSIPKTSSNNMPEIIGMSGDAGRSGGGGESRSQSNNPLGFLDSESDSNQDSSSSSSTSSDNDDESDDSNNGQEETTNKQTENSNPPQQTTTDMADFGLDLSSESSSDDSDGS